MKTLIALLVLSFSLSAMASEQVAAPAVNPCQNPQPLFGKIVATCGDQMITFVGTEKMKILGMRTLRTVFELAYCENGGGRYQLNVSSNSEGYTMTIDPEMKEQFKVINMWGEFKLIGTDYNGKAIDVKCVPYIDQRKNIEYIF